MIGATTLPKFSGPSSTTLNSNLASAASNYSCHREGTEVKALRKRAGDEVGYRAGIEEIVNFIAVIFQQSELIAVGGFHYGSALRLTVRTGRSDIALGDHDEGLI